MSEHFDEGDLHDTPPVQTRALATIEPQRDTTPEGLMALAIERGMSVEGLEKLMVLAAQVRADRAKTAFNSALASFQASCPVIEKTRPIYDKNGKLRYKHAAMEDIKVVVAPILSDHGLSYSFDSSDKDGMFTVFCHIRHEEGHSETNSFSVPIDKGAFMSAPQQFAAARTFAQRYALGDGLGIVVGDEDNDAAAPQKPQQAAQPARQQAPPPKPDVPANLGELQAAMAEWNKFLDSCPTIKELNDQQLTLKKWPEAVWKAVRKNLILPWAEKNGWEWQKDTKLFFEPTS